MNSGSTIHYLDDFAVIITALRKGEKVFLTYNNTGNTLSQKA